MNSFVVNQNKEYTLTEMYFDKNGVVTDDVDNKKIFAKITYRNDKPHSFHIRTFQNAPYDPMGTYGNREKYIETKIKKVSKSTFDFYVMYLTTNNSIYMTKAQRGYLND
tara:strand:+ start:502 stop:828 length:327 start_codon:yes stop_codon:yes gene_type:complete